LEVSESLVNWPPEALWRFPLPIVQVEWQL
jgi:hypothetical protein